MRKTIPLLLLSFLPILLHLSIPVTSTYAQEASPLDYTLRRIRVPILMYHYISETPEDADEYRVGLSVTPSLFRDHMQYLQDNGYNTISLYELDEALNNGYALPPKPVVLTFDDGYIDHYQQAFPILQEFGFQGTFFVVTSRLDNKDPNHLSWAQANEMEDAGMSIEAHTKSHLDLRNRNQEQLIYEILGSIESIEAHTGRRPHMFSYPAGQYDNGTLSIVASTNIQRAVTTQTGTSHTSTNRFELNRLRVQGNMSVAGIQYLLNL